MSEKKTSGFRFRLPWLLQPSLAPQTAVSPEPPTQPPRATIQTSVASTSAQRPPFRPPGKAPARSLVSAAASPPRVPAKSPQSAIAKPPAEETQTETIPTKTSNPTTPPEVEETALETQPTKETQTTAKTVQATEPSSSKTAKNVDAVETHPTKETQTATEAIPTIETPRPNTPPQRSPSPPKAPSPAKSEPSFPSHAATRFQVSSNPVSPSRMPAPPQTNSQPPSPSRMAAQSHVPTKPSSPSLGVTQTQATSQTSTPPRSPSRSVSPPTDKTPSPSSTTTSTVQRHEVLVNQAAQLPSSTPISDNTPEIKRSKEMADLAIDAKPKEIRKVEGTQTASMNPYSMDKIQETKSHKTKPTIAARVPIHREIKDGISKFIHKMATSPQKQYMDEKPASVITLAGDNKGASMHLGSEVIQREGAINGEGSSNGKKSERDSNTGENQETKAIINSNVQGINNSMMFKTSVKERNPGVHVVFSRNMENTNDSKIKNTESMEMHKAEAEITPPRTIVYAPTFRSSHGEVYGSERL